MKGQGAHFLMRKAEKRRRDLLSCKKCGGGSLGAKLGHAQSRSLDTELGTCSLFGRQPQEEQGRAWGSEMGKR